MKRIVAFAWGLSLLLAAAPTSPQATAHPATEPPRPEFYADEVLDDADVGDPENALDAPDGFFAEIRPGGELIVRMSEIIRYSDVADDGRVVTNGSARYGLAGLFEMTEEGEPAWQTLLPGGTPGGFKLGPGRFDVTQSTDTLRIVNDDTRSVFVDAVIGFRTERPLPPGDQGPRRTKSAKTTSGRRP